MQTGSVFIGAFGLVFWCIPAERLAQAADDLPCHPRIEDISLMNSLLFSAPNATRMEGVVSHMPCVHIVPILWRA